MKQMWGCMPQASGLIKTVTDSAPNKFVSVDGLRLPSNFLRTPSSLSSYDSPPTYTYVIFNRTAAISSTRISQYQGSERRLALSPPLPHPATPTSRYLLLPPSSILHMGVVTASVGEGGDGGHAKVEGSEGQLGARCFVALERSASGR